MSFDLSQALSPATSFGSRLRIYKVEKKEIKQQVYAQNALSQLPVY
jgi:hypothetical protein